MVEILEQNPRLKKLVRLLMNSDWITGNELAQNMGVTDRTIRKDMTLLKDFLSEYDASIQAVKGRGYLLSMSSRKVIDELIHTEFDGIPTLPEERLCYLIIKIAYSNSPVNLEDLEDALFVSSTTMESDLRVIKQQFIKPSNVELKREGKDVWLDGEEMNIRLMLKRIFQTIDNSFENRLRGNRFQYIMDEMTYQKISELMIQSLKDYHLKISDKDIMDAIWLLAIVYTRIECEFFIEEDQIQETIEIDPIINVLTKDIISKIAEMMSVTIPSCEEKALSIFLMDKRYYKDVIEKSDDFSDFNPKYIVIVQSLLNDIKNEYVLDLTQDKELFKGLVFHIEGLVNRSPHVASQQSPILAQLKNEYPYIFELSMFCFKKIREIFDKDVSEDDLSYISAHIGAAVERLENQFILTNFKVALISHLNYSASHWLLMKLKSHFNAVFDIEGPFSIFERETMLNSRPSLVLTTLPLEDIPVDTITITPLLNHKDIEAIGGYLKKAKMAFTRPKFPEDISQYFDRTLFYEELDISSYEQVITFMSKQLSDRGFVPKSFSKKVIEREYISATSFSQGIAIPHPIDPCSYRTIISVGILKKPILWGRYRVKYVFLLAIRDEDKKYLGQFFKFIVDLTENKLRALSPLKSKNFDEFIKMIH